ncbi:isopentenyl-diphosphate Delta-isomerase [Corynebacterium alimapuense]|uniref:Isopentenyl-diphosphate Delta-isomerase n=1 Tax=Corynebacterium alimapuense TaxID=1576874 RepID=A0A3M8K8N3_9CORY|nr:isopentenyl-diphosphate Delta-isomerase [Corynebacterium alimapuense]RNE49597.1 isopentenyl-diphosphate delta-isomerase [Corynebacterium alimapuense]
MTDEVELVVLADAQGRPAGTAPKATVHSADTPLHFAFSCYLLDAQGRLLMTRRALSKKTWPGVWTNSFCGHPGPGEATAAAIRRRSVQELGFKSEAIAEIVEVLPDFSYRAVDSSGIVEWEICPVFVAKLHEGQGPNQNPEEIDSLAWVDPAALISAVAAAPFTFSPWLVEELAEERLRKALVGKD